MRNLPEVTVMTMTSLELAEMTGKQHKNVLRDIEVILENVGIDKLNFEHTYLDSQNRERKMYRLPKRETLLVTSKWSDKQRLAIIEKLDEEQKNLSPAEFLLYNAQKLVEQEKAIEKLQIDQIETKAQVKALVDGEDYFSIVGYCNLIGKKVDSREAKKLGVMVSSIAKERAIHIGKCKHPLYGSANTYPRELLKELVS